MPIPNFNHNNVIPPYLSNPINSNDLSPYECTITELCNKFSTSPERIEILKKLIAFRARMHEYGLIYGFQWLDGSFTENIEASERRPPRDLDVVTFYGNLSKDEQQSILAQFPEFANPSLSKLNYKLDHYLVDLNYRPFVIVDYTRYWVQLFSHKRNDIWKGILKLPLNTQEEDQNALDYLNSLL